MKLYEDDLCSILLAQKSASPGHMIVLPHQAKFLEDFSHDDVDHLLTAASIASSMLFELVKPAGTSIVACNGAAANISDEVIDRLNIHILARMPDDGLGLLWQPQPGDQQEISSVASKIKDAMIFGDVNDGPVTIAAPVQETRDIAPESKPAAKEPSEDLRVSSFKDKYYQ